MKGIDQKTFERFWSNVTKTEKCWLWKGSQNIGGYGAFKHKKKRFTATRFLWFMITGEHPDRTLQMCHRCDNPPCVRPDHLFLGTASDNAVDRVQKGRGRVLPDGMVEPFALTEEMVIELKRYFVAGASTPSLSRLTGIDARTIGDVRHGRTWKYVPFPRMAATGRLPKECLSGEVRRSRVPVWVEPTEPGLPHVRFFTNY